MSTLIQRSNMVYNTVFDIINLLIKQFFSSLSNVIYLFIAANTFLIFSGIGGAIAPEYFSFVASRVLAGAAIAGKNIFILRELKYL